MQDPPYRRIVAEIRERIERGEWLAGERIPSIRQVARHWGVAVATATKVLATLRDEGWVESRVGSGTVVSTRAIRHPSDRIPPLSPPRRPDRVATAGSVRSRTRIVHTAIAVADAEGLDALSMRRLATEVGVGPMSLYRYVANKDDLVTQMADAVFGERELPEPGPPGWRAKLELIAHIQWDLYQRHLWLSRVVSFTRPLLVPNAMAHTEWTLRALDDLGLLLAVRTREAIALTTLVLTAALALAAEVEAGQEGGVTIQHWWRTRQEQADKLLASGRFPLLATLPRSVVTDLNGLFEYTLARHLDGFAVLVNAGAR